METYEKLREAIERTARKGIEDGEASKWSKTENTGGSWYKIAAGSCLVRVYRPKDDFRPVGCSEDSAALFSIWFALDREAILGYHDGHFAEMTEPTDVLLHPKRRPMTVEELMRVYSLVDSAILSFPDGLDGISTRDLKAALNEYRSCGLQYLKKIKASSQA